MDEKNKLNVLPVADVLDNELQEIKSLEKKLGDKYYLIAFDKNNELHN